MTLNRWLEALPMHDMPDRQAPREGAEAFHDLRLVGSSLLGVTAVGCVLTAVYVWWNVGRGSGLSVLWALALFAAAVGVGFLFAIPRVLQGGPEKATPGAGTPGSEVKADAPTGTPEARYGQRVNTNLEEISDWLTKIIVGSTLIHLKSIPTFVGQLGFQVVRDLPSAESHRGLGVAVVVFFSSLGSLFGYLVTRLYIQGALARAETDVQGDIHRLQRELELRLRQTRVELTVPRAARTASADTSMVDVLTRAADDYLTIAIPDWAARVQAKDDAAARLAQLAIDAGVSKDWLAAQDHEGLRAALAVYVQARPEAGDAGRLLAAAPRVQRLHVKYRFVLAFSVLLKKGLVTPAELNGIQVTLAQFERGADASLLRIIQAVRLLMRNGATAS